jgi:hypothetical protein
VERGVEAGEGWDLWVELRCSADKCECGGNVERRVVDGGAECVEDLRCDVAVLDEMRAAMDDAVADAVETGA